MSATATTAISKYNIAFLAIIAMAAEAVIVELFYVVFAIPTLTVAAIAVPVAGLALLLMRRRGVLTLFRQQYKPIVLISFLLAITEFMWYGAVPAIGAGKVSLIGLLETILIVAMAWIFLHERLTKTKVLGMSIVLIGIAISLSLETTTSSVPGGAATFGIGEVEAILASVSAAAYVIIVTRLLSRRHAATDALGAAAASKTAAESPASAAASAAAVAVAEAAAADEVHVTGFSLLLSGLMLQVQWLSVAQQQQSLQTIEWIWLLVFTPIMPLTVFLFQFTSYARIGASLTSIIVSMYVFVVITIQMILYYSSIPVALPENLLLAFVGGAVSVGGIVVIFANER